MAPLTIVFCAAEVAPFAKVGGLGDVMGALPKALAAMDDTQVMVLMPRYGCVEPEVFGFQLTETEVRVPWHGHEETLGLWRGHLPGCGKAQVLMLEHAAFAHPPEVYPHGDRGMEFYRFRLFCAAVLPTLKGMGVEPHILHLNDWHTATLAGVLAYHRREDAVFAKTRSVLTLHNMAYQGWEGYGGTHRNWLAEGLEAADWLTTVSPTYAAEIQTQAHGHGLDHLIRHRSGQLTGILNGIDTELYNPETDRFVVRQYGAEGVSEGKEACKQSLQKELGLPVLAEAPLFGVVSRLVEQKGIDWLVSAIEWAHHHDAKAQWVVLGSGEPWLEEALRQLLSRVPTLRIYLGFNVALAQKIYAGSDFFIMPSRFEPCGLGQMIAMRYGTLPVVRCTGGLADSVVDAWANPDGGTGIVYNGHDAVALKEALLAAVRLYEAKPLFEYARQQAMRTNVGWRESAERYERLYRQLVPTEVTR